MKPSPISLRTVSWLALGLILILLAASGEWWWSREHEEPRSVRVGLYENPPKIYTNPRGAPTGLFVELLEEIARAENWSLRYVPCAWAECLAALRAGEIDLMPDVAYSAERALLYDFHRVSVASSWSQIYADPALRIQSLDELEGRRIAILQGGIQQYFFAQLMDAGKHEYIELPVSNLDQGYTAVQEGQADAVVSNSFFAARNGSKYQLQETPIVFLPTNLYFASPKGKHEDLLASIDRHLTQWRQDSESIYFHSLRRSMAMPPEVLLPAWVMRSLLALGAILLLFFVVSLLLRWQVQQRTRALTQTTHELEQQRANLERLVAERSGELQAVFDSASVGIALVRDRCIQRCNRSLEEMFGYAPSDLHGSSARVLYAEEETWERLGREAYAPMYRGETFVTEEQAVRKDGSRFWVRISGRIAHPDAPERGVVVILADITAERDAVEQMRIAKELAEEATRQKSDFLANMSHEIRTPMNAILGMLYLALKGELPPQLRGLLSKAQGAAHSLLGILNDILDFSKIEAGKLEIEHVEFRLDSVLEQLTDAVGFQSERKGIEFLIRYDVKIPNLLVGDPLRLGQVLLNLCGNAVKFTEEGEVELAFRCISLKDNALTLQVSVRDSGIGMSPEVQARLFQKFTQADQSTTRRFGGTGLGLAICRNLVERMGGRLWIEESIPGRGTTISFSARLDVARQNPSEQDARMLQAGPLLAGVRVLVVDDNEVSREILCEMLRFFRLEVASANNGLDAIDLLREAVEPFELVLMDWRMPGMNGDEVTQRIHQDAAIRPQPKVVMVTAYGREDVIRLAEQAGVEGFLIKPVSPSTLLDTILSVLGRGRLLDDQDQRQATRIRHTRSGELCGARILLVEDNEINREFATELLLSEGIEVDHALDGEEAVRKVGRQEYDAVLMDIQMPVMDGLEATRQIRLLGRTPGREALADLPIIAMTALAMAHDASLSLDAGMNDHVSKPVDPDHLMRVLAHWLHPRLQRPQSRQNFQPAGAIENLEMPAGSREVKSTAASVPAAPSPFAPSQIDAFPADLAALTTLDAREGVRRIGGKVEAYRRQLRRFREHYADAAEELQRRMAQSGSVAAEEYCHALKGVAGNLGATPLYDYSNHIDQALKAGELPSAEEIAELRQRLGALLDEIDHLAPPRPAAPERPRLTDEELRTALKALIDTLENDLGAAETVLQNLRGGCDGSPLQPEIETIAEYIDRFELDEATTLLNHLLNRLAEPPRHDAP